MNRKARARLAARKKASRPDRFIEDGYSHWKFSKGKATSASSESKIENVEISTEEISQLINSGELDVNAKKAALSGGQWVTIEGRHVYLKGGKIVAGPPDLKGQTIQGDQAKTGDQHKTDVSRSTSDTGDSSKPTPELQTEDYRKNGVRSRAFKEWFGDWEKDPANASKVVDKHTGEPKETYGEEPKALYHGRQAAFESFDLSKAKLAAAGLGVYFAENRRIADTFATMGGKKGDVITAYMSIKKPFNFDTPIHASEVEGWSRETKEMKGTGPKYFTATVQAYQRRDGNPDGTMPGHVAWRALRDAVGDDHVNKVLQRLGYDGIVHTSSDQAGAPRLKAGDPDFGRVWVAFEPNQIKAVDNKGAFDPSSHNIYNDWTPLISSLAHSDPTLVADFDPSQARDTHGRWSPSGKANAFDHVLEHSGTEKNQTVRDFYKTVHRDVSTTRPAGDPRFHDPLRLHIEKQLHELAGDHGEALYRTGAAGMTQIAFKKHEVNVVTDAPGQVTIFSEHLHGPDPRDPTTFTITHETPHEEVSYRLRKAAGLKVDKVAAEKYMAEDRKARNEFRAQRKAALEAQKTAREARRAEKEARRASAQNADISAEDISQLINDGELDVPAIGGSSDDTPTSSLLDDELLDRILENLDLASNAVTGPNPWAPYVGKRGGRGWKNGITGRVAYQLNQPGLGRRAAATPAGTGAPTAPAPVAPVPGQPRAQRANPADVKDHITKLLSDPSKITAADIHKVREDLLSMTVAQIHGVRKDLGLKASGVKKDLADKVATRALAGLGKVQTQPQTAPTPPQHQPPAPAQHPTPAPTPAQHPPSHLDVKDPVAVRTAVHAFIAGKNWSGGAAGILRALAHGGDRALHTIGAHLASLTGVPHDVGFDLAHTAVKELVAGLPTHQPKAPTPPTPPAATPAQPAAAGSPSPLHRGANVITGVPAQAPMALPVVPHRDEIQWSTGKPEPGTLHGVDFASAPHHFWEQVKDKDIGEPKPTRPINRAGVMIQEPDGRIWIVRPTNEFGDRKHTLPGGGVESGLTNQQNALKEVWEETGLQVEITGHLGDFRDSNNGNNGRLYIGRRIGGAPWDAKIEPHIIDRKTGKPSAESSEVLLVTPERAGKLLHRSDDLAQLMTVAPIPLSTATRGRGSEPIKKLLEAVQPAAKAYRDARQAVNATPGNAELHAIQDIRGFNAKPTVVSKNDMDALVAKGDHIEVLRGLAANAKPNVSARRVVDTLAEQFRTGDHYPGYGIFGSGTYTDSTKGYGNIASKYASGQRGGGGSDAGATLRMAIPKDAKIVKFSELQSKVPHAPPDFTDHGPSSYNSNDDWRGMHAALAGYDAIHMDNHGYGHDFYVILNRGVVTVQREDATGHVIR
jgi:ADP-ribose pyrophosphatase YjhB (NUDIX family)